MGFEVQVNGESVWSTEGSVQTVHLQSAQGEAGTFTPGPGQEVCNIVVDERQPTDIYYDDEFALRQEQIREFKEKQAAATATANKATTTKKASTKEKEAAPI